VSAVSEPVQVCALTVAGSDSGGGAGIQADLQAFSYFGVFGTCAITAVTAQNPAAVTDVAPVPPPSVRAQIDAVVAAFAVGAIKTGMLFSAEIIDAVAEALAAHAGIPLVVDPVMVATSGARLLRPDAVESLGRRLLPAASLTTPNLPEAEILLGRDLRDPDGIPSAARDLAREYGVTVLLKGGHTAGGDAVDVLSDGDSLWELRSPRVSAATTHGTGCSLSAAIAACLACGDAPLEAARRAKAYVLGRLRACRRVGPRSWGASAPECLPLGEVSVSAVGL
jgi:hydroxymethylpyrimidine/phosphomethylpyrimidine kinase